MKVHLSVLIREYLESQDYDTSVVEAFFSGMVERVVALVSRIQGTYEFEVQPLREYFAARHLFETAPYSPTGNERMGTRPDRFDALARNSYWLNVTRFFAGCFSKGELPALADSLEELWGEEPYCYLERPKMLGAMLLSDWVFSQHPRSQRRCTDALFEGATLREAAYALRGRPETGNAFVFSVAAARAALLDRCLHDLATGQKIDYELGLCSLARANGLPEEIYDRWCSMRCRPVPLPSQSLLRLSVHLRVVDHIPASQLDEFLDEAYNECLPWIVFSDREDVYCATAKRYSDAVDIVAGSRFRMRHSENNLLGLLAQMIDVDRLSYAFNRHRVSDDIPFGKATGLYYGAERNLIGEATDRKERWNFELEKRLCDLSHVYLEEAKRPLNEWKTTLEPWDNFVEKLRSTIGTGWAAYRIAKLVARQLPAAALREKQVYLLDPGVPLCSRALSATEFADRAEWWERCLSQASDPDEIAFVLVMMFEIANEKVILSNLGEINVALQGLSDAGWESLLDEVVHFIGPMRPSRRLKFAEKDLPEVNGRLYTLLALQCRSDRAAEIYLKRLLSYAEDDIGVWRGCMGLAIVAAQRKPTLWSEILLPLRMGYAEGAIPAGTARLRLYSNPEEAAKMPVEVAVEICKNADLYPLMVLNRAATVLHVHVEEKRTCISDIAKQDRWFAATA